MTASGEGYRVTVVAPDGQAVGSFDLGRDGDDVTTASGRAFLGMDVATAVELHRRRVERQARADVIDGRGVAS